MAINATKPATPAAAREAAAGGTSAPLESANTVHPSEVEPTEDARIPPGTIVADRYRIARLLGEGGMGVVYAAEHVLMRKEVALKVLHAEMCTMPEVVARFEREAIAAAHIDHPNVAGATDFGRLEDGSCYLVLELLKGTSLRDEILKGPIPLGRALSILRGIASGVSAAHVKGIVHRDLKPENVMLVERDGIADFVKVLDFGIAKVDATVASAPQSAGKILTRVGAVFGTPEYMAPEQAVGDTVDARADLYALGVVLLEMVTGKCPFTGNALSILRERILASGPPDMSAVPDPGTRALVARLLTRQADDRMQTASELVQAVDALLDEHGAKRPSAVQLGPVPIAAPPSGAAVTATTNPIVADRVSVPAPKKRWYVIPVGVAAALVITFGAFGLVNATFGAKEPTPTASGPARVVETSTPASSVAEAPAAPSMTTEPAASESVVETPAPTTSAASARATPRGRPSSKPVRPQKKGGLSGFKDWLK